MSSALIMARNSNQINSKPRLPPVQFVDSASASSAAAADTAVVVVVVAEDVVVVEDAGGESAHNLCMKLASMSDRLAGLGLFCSLGNVQILSVSS